MTGADLDGVSSRKGSVPFTTSASPVRSFVAVPPDRHRSVPGPVRVVDGEDTPMLALSEPERMEIRQRGLLLEVTAYV